MKKFLIFQRTVYRDFFFFSDAICVFFFAAESAAASPNCPQKKGGKVSHLKMH